MRPDLSAIPQRLAGYRAYVAQVEAQTGKGLLRQMAEIRALRKMGGQCGVSDYYWYRLYDESFLYGRGPCDFIGWRLQESFSASLNPRHVVLPAWDKITFLTIAAAAGLPVAPILACYHHSPLLSPVLGRHLKSPAEVAEFLRDPSVFPLFSKPSYSQQGHGAEYLVGYDSATDALTLLDGRTIAVTKFLDRLDRAIDHYHRPECGFLFQNALKLAPAIAELTNWTAICGVRVMCLNGPEGARPIRAMWKIAVPPNHVDNFSRGRYGNLFANVDLANGEVNRMLSGFWPEARILDEHPRTGRRIAGFRLPGWDRILAACRDGGKVFPLMKIQHWDFAITDQGPQILELNDICSTEAAQLHGHGLLTAEIRAFLKRFGDARKHPWINAL